MSGYCARGQYDKAIAKLTRTARMLPLLRWAWHILGEAYSPTGNWEEAIKVCKPTIRRLPTDYSLYQRLTNTHLSISNHHRVIECYEVIQEILDDHELLAVYSSITASGVLIDERFRENLLWYPISETHKRQDHKAHRIYDSVSELYQKAIRERENCFRVVYFHGTP